MKKILIVIHDMRIGGAQKSLLSFLQSLTEEHYQNYAISLMVIDPVGSFYTQIPEQIRILPPPKELRWLGSRFDRKLLREHFSWRCLYQEVHWLMAKKLCQFPQNLNLQQKLWHHWNRIVPTLKDSYYAAISYMDGVPCYYVMDKVKADKKLLWVHSEYQKQEYDPEFDRGYYEKADGIITISDNCRRCILTEFPEYAHKTHILENISSAEDIMRRSLEFLPKEYGNEKKLKLLTVARLNYQKGVDIAVDAAARLKKEGIDFCWLVVGDGPEREKLQQQITEQKLSDCMILLGSRENPYVYMKHCDILVQPSRVEGKSIVLDEAKILCKPIVATNYTTVGDSLVHGETGWIVDMTPKAVADGIIHLWQDAPLRERLAEHLKALPKSDEALLRQYIQNMFE